jgi:hypothetical protein
MGVWGAGLYSGDFAMDLRATIRAVARLPFDGDKLVDILCDTEPAVAHNPDHEEHSTFWLVVADQFARRAIVCSRARERALAILVDGSDLAMHDKLGMNAPGLKQRRKMLEEVRVRIMTPPAGNRPRTVLRKPQALLMEVGDVFVYPTFDGQCINPCFGSKEQGTYFRNGGMTGWTQNGWSALAVVDCGRAFEFLSWYRPLTISTATAEKPTLGKLHDAQVLWKLGRPGTCSSVHLKRMEFEKIGTLAIDTDQLRRSFGAMPPGTSAAVGDISIANTLHVGPKVPAALMPRPGEPPNFSHGRPYPTILGIGQILSG